MAAFELVSWVLRGLTAATFLAMGLLHFIPSAARVMAKIVPPRMRRGGLLSPLNLVYLTGVCEIVGGIGILLPWTRLAAGIALAVLLVAVFPANAYASKHPDRFGRVAIPFWPRLVAQLGLIALVLLAGMLG